MTRLEKIREDSASSRYSDAVWPENGEAYRIVYQEGWRDCANEYEKIVKELEEYLIHCRDFDTSAKFGYEYGQEVRGKTPRPGSRWNTPKEAAESALAKLKKFRGKNE